MSKGSARDALKIKQGRFYKALIYKVASALIFKEGTGKNLGLRKRVSDVILPLSRQILDSSRKKGEGERACCLLDLPRMNSMPVRGTTLGLSRLVRPQAAESSFSIDFEAGLSSSESALTDGIHESCGLRLGRRSMSPEARSARHPF
jgi:hypothetical protein